MDQSDTDSTTRIDELETRIAEQDQSMIDLSDEVYRQQQQISQLETKVRHLAERLQLIATLEPANDSIDEIPPHY